MKQRVTLATVCGLIFALLPSVALANGDEASLVASTNAERAAAGAGALSTDGSLTSIARAHSQAMAAEGTIFHSSNLGGQISGWYGLAENVGMAESAATAHSMLMNSSGHRANILNASYDRIGVGAVWSGGALWVTQIFVDSDGVSSSPPPEPAPAPPPEPAPAPPPEPATAPSPPSSPPESAPPSGGQATDEPTAGTETLPPEGPRVVGFNREIVDVLLPEDAEAIPPVPVRPPEALERASQVELEDPWLV